MATIRLRQHREQTHLQNKASFYSNVSHFYHKAAAEKQKEKPKKRAWWSFFHPPPHSLLFSSSPPFRTCAPPSQQKVRTRPVPPKNFFATPFQKNFLHTHSHRENSSLTDCQHACVPDDKTTQPHMHATVLCMYTHTHTDTHNNSSSSIVVNSFEPRSIEAPKRKGRGAKTH